MINIDSQLKRRMDQFRGRPQDLMQQYQVSRELIDLLALQKLKSEKDSAARNMMMQMQQNPQTVAAQREAELMGRTQQEVAQQVGGIAQLDDARRKQNLARMASQRPPMRMAEGGAVYAREGDPGFYAPPALESPETEAKLRRALELGTSAEDLQDILVRSSRISPGVAEQLVASAARQGGSPVTATVASMPLGNVGGSGGTQMDAALRRLKDLGGTFGRGIEGLLDYISPARAGIKLGQRFYDATTLPVEEYAAKYSPAPVDEDAPFEQQPIPGMSTDSLQEIDIASLPSRRPPPPAPTPEQLRNAEEVRVREALGQEGIMSAYQDMIQRQRSLAERVQDPEQQRRDRLAALLRGMAGRSTFGLTGAGGSAGIASERRRQNALAQQLLDKEFGLTKEQLGAQVNIGKEALAGGREAFAQASETARAVAKANQTLMIEQLKLAQEGRLTERDIFEAATEMVSSAVAMGNIDPEDRQNALRETILMLNQLAEGTRAAAAGFTPLSPDQIVSARSR